MIKDWEAAFILNVDIEPCTFDWECLFALNPVEENRSSVVRFSSLIRIIEVIVHPPAKIFSQSNVQNDVRKRR
jgi:hypothetical protein